MHDSAPEEYARDKSQWRVGIAALRGIRRLVDGYEKEERIKRAAAKYVVAGFALAVILVLVAFWFSPATIRDLFRSLS